MVRRVQYRKYGAYGYVNVDVGRAVQGIEQQQVLALGIAVGNAVYGFHFFGSHGSQVAAPFIGFQQNFVGRSDEHTSELKSLMRKSYAVFCSQKKNNKKQ